MSNSKTAVRFLAVLAGSAFLPGAARACPACMVGDPKNAGTYLGMTLIMSALPILLACGLGYWLWRRHS
jgi:phosphotransferase system  glucose/maltose/N-acetylglucosamine-specific IIC component